ncbi:hypothetical protein EV356DRAFT_500023 [Viridothelium virens]|uniref:Uncharacterized protein n=1 Tax=Viridothelium virens TaxID=1048519 RepID=A0A6A6HCF6_VIRVR|nr:hypothetical protein EV356DRAFT_500023 [Viridothelium virens]
MGTIREGQKSSRLSLVIADEDRTSNRGQTQLTRRNWRTPTRPRRETGESRRISVAGYCGMAWIVQPWLGCMLTQAASSVDVPLKAPRFPLVSSWNVATYCVESRKKNCDARVKRLFCTMALFFQRHKSRIA